MTNVHAPQRAGRLSRNTCIWASCLLLAGLGAPLAGQPDVAPPAEPERSSDLPRFRVEANFVRVDVYVSQNGAPVRDLGRDDFEVFEDGKPQPIETFEHVEIDTWVPQEQRREPQSVRESRAMAEDPRARVFVIFLDTHHTDVIGSHRMQRPIVNLLDRMLGPDDLFAVMTPQMSVKDLAFAKRSEVTEGMLHRHWAWGQEDRLVKEDPVEQAYQTCYGSGEGSIADEMIARRREWLTLSAIDELALSLRYLREERKAVIAVTSGWLLFQPNPRLADTGGAPTPPAIGVGPDGRLARDPHRVGYGSPAECARERITLAGLDNRQYLFEILERANRSNVSFYPIDAQGLRSWNTDLGSQPIGAPAWYGQETLRHRRETMELLANGTDGFAVVDTNDLDRGMRRIANDLSAYYLLGYYSTNGKLDGRFRSIRVRVRRPGVEVRARKGYRALTAEEVEESRQLTAAADRAAMPSAVQQALGALGGIRSKPGVSGHVSWVTESAGASGRLWVTTELDLETSRSAEWAGGGTAEVLVMTGDGRDTIAMARETLAPGTRVVTLAVPDAALPPGEHVVRLRVRPSGGGLPLTDAIALVVPDGGTPIGPPRLLRRGPTTGAQYVPAAVPAFDRTERVRVEVPASVSITDLAAELLDRNGATMAVPVGTNVREEGGIRWAVAEMALAPLAPGDYVVRLRMEIGTQQHESLTGLRVVR